MNEIEKIIKNTNETNQEKVNWTKVWSKKYPVLSKYQEKIDVEFYEEKLEVLLSSLQETYHYSRLDAMLVLKDILYSSWKKKNS